jgi:nitrogen regulatory protein PII-like uncharacterized protein
MGFYIFTRDKRSPSSWKFLEMAVRPEVAKRILADYRSILRRESDTEVVIVEANGLGEARQKLESQGD